MSSTSSITSTLLTAQEPLALAVQLVLLTGMSLASIRTWVARAGKGVSVLSRTRVVGTTLLASLLNLGMYQVLLRARPAFEFPKYLIFCLLVLLCLGLWSVILNLVVCLVDQGGLSGPSRSILDETRDSATLWNSHGGPLIRRGSLRAAVVLAIVGLVLSELQR